MLQLEKTSVRPSRKDFWTETHTRKDVIPIDAAYAEAVVCFNYRNSITINSSKFYVTYHSLYLCLKLFN